MSRRNDPNCVAIRAQVLTGIAGNRIEGLHFPGYFLGLAWPKVDSGSARLVLADGPHCRDADGAMDIAALAFLADTALATSARTQITPGARLATLHMQMQFTGLPAVGDISAEARLLGVSDVGVLHQSLCAATLYANGKPVCHASGEFAALDPPPGVKLAPLPWQLEVAPSVVPLAEDTLEPHERAILDACDRALAKATPALSFVQHLWGGMPKRVRGGATNRVAIGQHLSNRVGHVQGGISFGIAVTCACAAAPATMLLSNVSAWYIGPGLGKHLNVRSRVVHAGRTIAVVRTEIKTDSGDRVLEVVTHHVARKRAKEL